MFVSLATSVLNLEKSRPFDVVNQKYFNKFFSAFPSSIAFVIFEPFDQFKFSVTKLGYFWQVLATNFLTKVVQILGNF